VRVRRGRAEHVGLRERRGHGGGDVRGEGDV
jgi:hypothetical protein